MSGGIEQLGIPFENRLRSVAVMDVEIDHGDALKPMDRPRLIGAEGDVVKQAKAHGRTGFGMMARRANGTEGIGNLPHRHRVDGCEDRAGGAQGGLAGTGREDGIGIEGNATCLRHRRQQSLDIGGRMGAHDLFERGRGRLCPF